MRGRNVQKEIANALEKELIASGLPNEAETKKLFRRLTNPKPIKGDSSQLIAKGFFTGLAAIIRANARKQKIKTGAELDKSLANLRGLRYKLRPAIARALEEVKKGLPRNGGPGRPKKLNETERRSVCGVIGTYIANGMTVDDAIQQISKERKIPVRTLYRYWKDRGLTT